MKSLLDQICDKKKIELENDKKKCSYQTLEKLLDKKNKRKFQQLLINSHLTKKNNIIAEIKKASPSAGIIIDNYFPESIAIEYEKSGVGAISILTEKNFFMGKLDHLSLIHINSKIPILRKDFIFDPYQILQSKVYNADAILLIAAILSDNQIKEFIDLAMNVGLDCLLEVHTYNELERAINIDHPIIGINNRNLTTLNVDNNITTKLVEEIPDKFTIVAESGIKNREQIMTYNKLGVFNFLIGESILKSSNIKMKIKELKG